MTLIRLELTSLLCSVTHFLTHFLTHFCSKTQKRAVFPFSGRTAPYRIYKLRATNSDRNGVAYTPGPYFYYALTLFLSIHADALSERTKSYSVCVRSSVDSKKKSPCLICANSRKYQAGIFVSSALCVTQQAILISQHPAQRRVYSPCGPNISLRSALFPF